MSRKRHREKTPVPAPPPGEASGGRVPPRPATALALGLVAFVVGLVPALLQPWDPGAPGAQKRTPPDEIAHILYLQDLVRERRLPLLTSGSGNYEAHQPPLYYLSAIPARQLGLALAPPPDPAHPATTWGEVLAVRLWSVLIAAGVIVSCYLVGTVAFPQSRLLQLAPAGFALLLPGHIVGLAAVTNDGLAELFCCLALWQCVSLLRWPTGGYGRFTLLGALIGAALLTKTSCVFLLPVALFAVLLGYSPAAGKPVRWSAFLGRAAVTLGVAVALWAGWIVHNLSHYPGDPLVTRTFLEVFGKDRPSPGTFIDTGLLSPLGYLRMVLTWTYCSFWGVFGEAAVFMRSWYYLLGTALTAAALIGVAARAAQWRRATPESRAVWSILAAAGILVGLQFLRFEMDFFQAQARYLLPAIAPIACAFIAGLDGVARRLAGRSGRMPKARVAVFGACGVTMAVLLVTAFVAVAARGHVGPPPPWIGLPR